MICPACKHPLSLIEKGGIKLDTCHGGCGGIWFDANELEAITGDPAGGREPLFAIPRKANAILIPTGERICPRCEAVRLEAREIGGPIRVVIDTCPACKGVWLDAGELAALQAVADPPAPVVQNPHDPAKSK